ncbi:unnamed protein product [Microthlaspi erraticum]|uniref:Uncharacterized protein n=1 Tax=Microthlaspi erraticum TaxID=1685480 RepID=A0A6D2ITK0_9BRAS|nr:unnamed protein product [Microthlaspi erraticum]
MISVLQEMRIKAKLNHQRDEETCFTRFVPLMKMRQLMMLEIGVMREVEVGTGLSGALKRLREQGTFKEKKGKLVVGGMLTEKDAFRLLCHGFHGKKPGKRKEEKRKRKHQDQSKQMESSDRAVERMRQVHAGLKTPYVVL